MLKKLISIRALTFVIVVISQVPAIAFCAPQKNWFGNLFASKATSANVATKLVELSEKFDILVHAVDFSPNGK